MGKRHYAPNAKLIVVAPSEWERAVAENTNPEQLLGVLVRSTEFAPSEATCALLPSDPVAFARQLYGVLHRLDAECDVILVQAVPDTSAWGAIRDRLERASCPR